MSFYADAKSRATAVLEEVERLRAERTIDPPEDGELFDRPQESVGAQLAEKASPAVAKRQAQELQRKLFHGASGGALGAVSGGAMPGLSGRFSNNKERSAHRIRMLERTVEQLKHRIQFLEDQARTNDSLSS